MIFSKNTNNNEIHGPQVRISMESDQERLEHFLNVLEVARFDNEKIVEIQAKFDRLGMMK